jgi:hypothetical protein
MDLEDYMDKDDFIDRVITLTAILGAITVVAGIIALCFRSPAAPAQSTQTDDVKLCAESLPVLEAKQECSDLRDKYGNEGCTYTMGDLIAYNNAAANKQAYCPRLKEGEERANN